MARVILDLQEPLKPLVRRKFGQNPRYCLTPAQIVYDIECPSRTAYGADDKPASVPAAAREGHSAASPARRPRGLANLPGGNDAKQTWTAGLLRWVVVALAFLALKLSPRPASAQAVSGDHLAAPGTTRPGAALPGATVTRDGTRPR